MVHRRPVKKTSCLRASCTQGPGVTASRVLSPLHLHTGLESPPALAPPLSPSCSPFTLVKQSLFASASLSTGKYACQGAGAPGSWTPWCILSPCLCRPKSKTRPVPPFNFLAQSKRTSLLMIHTGGGLGGRGSVSTMDRRGCISLINMLAIHQLVQERGMGEILQP